MKTIDEQKLEEDLEYRFTYLCEFIGFGEDDIAVIHGAAPLLAPLVPSLVDAVYDKLQSFSSTWRHFVSRQHGYDGDLPTDLTELTQDHPQIKFRKQHLGRYITRLVTRPYDGKMVKYLNVVGGMHTSAMGSDSLRVPIVQMNALMGFVADAFNATIMGLELSLESKTAAIRAFSKLLWIQNDLIVKHYVPVPCP